jgi:DmsE family decaheme c-type cytochrome
MQRTNIQIPLLALAALLVVATAAPAAARQEAAAGGYAGAETCAACHSEVAEALAQTPHGKRGFEARSTLGCESCHGPAAAHAEDPDDESLRPRLDRLTPAEQAATCQSCHSGGNRIFWEGSRHPARGVSCTDCHSVHSPRSEKAQLRSATVMEQCFACHKDTRAETWKNSHHPIREGKITCADCHNPHGAQSPKMVKAVSVNDQCYSCHAEKRGPFIWDHAPVRENCLTCHTPHGSNHIKLQKTSVPYLCQQCHSNTRHPGTLYDGRVVPTLHDEINPVASNRLFNRACLDCHAAIHGSNHPSAPYLAH